MTLFRPVLIAALSCLLFAPGPLMADPVRISGPTGVLEGERAGPPVASDLVIIIPGSGPIDRDGNAPGMGTSSDSYRLLAEGLANGGIASLRIDKRGFYGSAAAGADPNQVTIAGYAEDVRAWVAEAAQSARCTWLAGHSEGGLVALLTATDPPKGLCGLILMAAPGRPIGRLMITQMGNMPGMAPLMPAVEEIIADLEAGTQAPVEDVPAPLRPLFSPGLQRFMIDLFSYDPAELAARWSGPALILRGTADLQVFAQDSATLAAALPQAQPVALPGVTHMLKQDVPGDPYATYMDPSLPIDPDLVARIITFVEQASPGD